MRYVDFKAQIQQALLENPKGFTWVELKAHLDLPYPTPCPEWVKQLEDEIGLVRRREGGRAYVWRIIR
ncbi:MAG: hypothetical protein V2J07_06935 [Anaerolineae bacterium]|jgi:hypothetical protein|nr:hypothetical protein [Anaerolineae bacterium]